MKKLTATERQMQILQLLNKNGAMKTLDLANYFHVSRETMRRDLMTLTEQGLIDKWFGGVICSDHLSQHPFLYEDMKTWFQNSLKDSPASSKKELDIPAASAKTEENDSSSLKTQIARKALSLISPGSTIFLDNGEISLCLAKLLSRLSGYTIITASIPVVNICMATQNRVIICGGVVAPQVQASAGTSAADFLNQLNMDAAVFESEGFQAGSGPTSSDLDYSQVQKAALQNARLRIVLAESSKAGYSSLTQFASWQDIDCLVTDSCLDPAFRNKYADSMHIVFADPL